MCLITSTTIRPLEHVECNCLLCLYLWVECIHQRLLQNKQNSVYQYTNRPFHGNYGDRYYTSTDMKPSLYSQDTKACKGSSPVEPASPLQTFSTNHTFASENNCRSYRAFTEHEPSKIHVELSHGTLSQMQSFLKSARKWRYAYIEIISQVVRICVCPFASPPDLRSVCSENSSADVNQKHIFINIVHFLNKHFLRLLDSFSR